MKLRAVTSGDLLRGKRVLLRVDLNEPTGSEATHDPLCSKMRRSLDTVRFLLHRGAKIILITHRGRPDGKHKAEFSNRVLVAPLTKLLGQRVKFATDVVGPSARKEAAKLRSREILLLENVRFEKGEEKNSPKFAKALAELGEVFVNDAFAVSHRAHASVAGVTKYLPSYAGIALMHEVQSQLRVLEENPKNLVVVMGGAKVSTKLEVLERFLKQGTKVLVGGAMATNFFKASGLEVGRSLWSKEDVELAKKLRRSSKLVLPLDVIVAKEMKNGAPVRMVPPFAIREDEMVLDVGLTTLCEFRAIIERAKTIIWNGPVGVSEIPTFAHGSLMLARTIAKRAEFGAFAVVGGGDSLPVVEMSGMSRAFSFISTGGGAMLEFLSGKMLPGLAPLIEK